MEGDKIHEVPQESWIDMQESMFLVEENGVFVMKNVEFNRVGLPCRVRSFLFIKYS